MKTFCHQIFDAINSNEFESVIRHIESCSSMAVRARNKDKRTPLHLAAKMRSEKALEMCKALISAGAEVNAVDDDDVTPLHLAARARNANICFLLLKSGANIDKIDNGGDTPLHYAWPDDLETVKCLVNGGADVLRRSGAGPTVLHNFVAEGSLEILLFLFETTKAASIVNKVDYRSTGLVPLHLACRFGGNLEICKALVDHGAIVNIVDCEGRTPLYFAQKYGNKEIINYLLEKGAIDEFPIQSAIAMDDAEKVKSLLGKDADRIVNQRLTKKGYSPLHYAARLGRVSIGRYLIEEKKANVNLVSKLGGKSALHMAASKGHVDFCKLLLDNGAYVDATDAKGDTPLMRACNRFHLDVCCLLLEKGADPNMENNDGYTPTIKSYPPIRIFDSRIYSEMLKFGGTPVTKRDLVALDADIFGSEDEEEEEEEKKVEE